MIDQANAKSVVAIMGLEIGYGDKVTLVAKGDDADAAIETLTPLLREGLGRRGLPTRAGPGQRRGFGQRRAAPRGRARRTRTC